MRNSYLFLNHLVYGVLLYDLAHNKSMCDLAEFIISDKQIETVPAGSIEPVFQGRYLGAVPPF